MCICSNYHCLNNQYGKCKLHQEKYADKCINFIPRNFYSLELYAKYKVDWEMEDL